MVLTHLVQLKFFHGATVNEAVVPATFAGHTTFPPFYAFKGFSVGDAVPEPEPEPSGQNVSSGAGSGKWPNEDELWEYIEALKAQFRQHVDERKQETAERLDEAQREHDEIHAEVALPTEPIDGLYAELDELLVSTQSLQKKWDDLQRIEREYRQLKEEEEVVRLLFQFVTDD